MPDNPTTPPAIAARHGFTHMVFEDPGPPLSPFLLRVRTARKRIPRRHTLWVHRTIKRLGGKEHRP